MPMLTSLARIAAKPLPRIVSPKSQAVMDYVTAGSFFAAAAWFWRRNKRASIAALLCGGAKLAVNMLTDYPGGTRRVINFQTRREIDLGLAAMTATMPEFLAFKEDPERKFFVTEGALIAAASELTQFPKHGSQRKERRAA